MKRENWHGVLGRVVLGMVFLYAGAVKLYATGRFADDVAGFQLLPAWGVSIVAFGLPVFEVFIGLMFVLNRGVRGAALGVIGMMAVFLFAIGQASLRGLEIQCGCFGEIPDVPWSAEMGVIRDVAILLLASVLYALRWKDGVEAVSG